MSTWAINLLNTSCSSSVLQLSRLQQDVNEQSGDITSIPTIANITIGDVEYTFNLSNQTSIEDNGSQDQSLKTASEITETLQFNPPIALKDDLYTFSLVVGSTTKEIEVDLKGCLDSQQSTGSQEDNAGSELSTSTVDNIQSQTSLESIPAEVYTAEYSSATQTISDYLETASLTWSLENVIETSFISAPSSSDLPDTQEIEASEVEEKKTVVSSSTAGGLILFFILFVLFSVLYYRRRQQRERRRHSPLMEEVWRSDA